MSKLKFALSLCFATLMLSGSALGADVSGKWSGTVLAKTPDGENKESAWMFLKQTGEVVTGTAGGDPNQQSEIKDGKVDGDKVAFRVAVGEAVASVTLHLDGDFLKGEAIIDTPDGKVTALLNLKRVP